MNEVNHLPPGFCKHGPYTCPQTRATARLLQTFPSLFSGCQVMVTSWHNPNGQLLVLPASIKVKQKLPPSQKEAGGRKQPPVDSEKGGGGW